MMHMFGKLCGEKYYGYLHKKVSVSARMNVMCPRVPSQTCTPENAFYLFAAEGRPREADPSRVGLARKFGYFGNHCIAQIDSFCAETGVFLSVFVGVGQILWSCDRHRII